MVKHKCVECGIKRKCIPVVRHVGGTMDYVCHLCYTNKYRLYLSGDDDNSDPTPPRRIT